MIFEKIMGWMSEKRNIEISIYMIIMLMIIFASLFYSIGMIKGGETLHQVLEDRCVIVLKMSDVCLQENKTFFVSKNSEGKIVGGCTTQDFNTKESWVVR